MATIPTTQAIIDNNLVILETNLNQTSPLNDKAFLRVIALMSGMNMTQLYKFGVEKAVQNLALTATGADLDLIGINYGVPRKAGVAAVLNLGISGSDGVQITVTNAYIGDSNGVRYFPDATATIAGGTALFDATADDVGIAGNLNVGDQLTIGAQVAGASPNATVSAIVTEGLNRESDDDYRLRVLNEIRTVGGGSNSADYRRWSEEVDGVERAYPYTGKPFDLGTPTRGQIDSVSLFPVSDQDGLYFGISVDGGNEQTITYSGPTTTADDVALGINAQIIGARTYISGGVVYIQSDSLGTISSIRITSAGTATIAWNLSGQGTGQNESVPGDRTVYVQADETVDPDGIAPQSLLDDVRTSITTDPLTGEDRQCLGSTDETLYVESIYRTEFLMEVRDLNVDASLEAAAKADLEAELEKYIRSVRYFVEGLDSEVDRNNTITSVALGEVANTVLKKYSGYASFIGFGLVPASFLDSYTMNPGELGDNGGISYA
jgi:hypothetical protein